MQIATKFPLFIDFLDLYFKKSITKRGINVLWLYQLHLP